MTTAAKAVAIEAEGAEPKRWKRQFINQQAAPADAIKWRTAAEKAKRLETWRGEVGKAFPESGRVLRIAWALEWLFGRDGFAFATDAYLSQKLGIPVNKIQSGLAELERSGSIARASVFVRNRPQRRIWPSSKILKVIPPTMGGIHTPHDGDWHTPHDGGTEYLTKTPAIKNRRISSTADDARRDAERREQAAARRAARAPSGTGMGGKTLDSQDARQEAARAEGREGGGSPPPAPQPGSLSPHARPACTGARE